MGERWKRLTALSTALLVVAAGSVMGESAAVADPTALPTVSRITAADRFELAVEIGKRVSPGATNVVYIASGATFPDALSAGPAASAKFAPLLLVPPDSLPASVAGSLVRLDPLQVIVVGGTGSVSDAVMASVRAVVPHAAVKRISGADRFDVSRGVAADAFDGVFAVGIATGRDFPDALSAGSVAGANGMPVVLVDGTAPAADAATQALLRSWNPEVAMIAGGPLSVSTGIQNTLLSSGLVTRVSGANRYEVSLNLAQWGDPDFSTVYLATASNFPDALAGGVLAAKTKSPMFVVPPDCVPRGVLSLIASKGTKNVVLIGGPASLGAGVSGLLACTF
jgi:putative cell wall-binding protein